MKKQKLRKIMIVIEETGTDGGQGFNVYLLGDKERFGDKTLKAKDLSPAEFWGSKLFNICIDALKQAGVVQTERNTTAH